MGTPLRSPAFEIESFSPRSESPRPSRRTLHLPGSARGGGSISCPSSASMCGRRTSVPRNRTFQARRIRAKRDCVAPIMVVAPSMEVARYEPKFRRDGARGTPRATIASPVSGKELVSPRLLRSQRTTAGTGPGLLWSSPRPDGRVSAASGWSLLSFWHRPREPPQGRQRVLHCLAEVHSSGLRRRSRRPRADMDRVVLEARSQSRTFRTEVLLPRGRLLPRTG